MTNCHGCGKYLSGGDLHEVQLPAEERARLGIPDGFKIMAAPASEEPTIVQPVKDGYSVWCQPCYRDRCPKPATAAEALATVLDPAATPETEAEYIARKVEEKLRETENR